MRNTPFLTADEIALFRCDKGADTEAFIVSGPVKDAETAFAAAFKHHDYDFCWKVERLDNSGIREDVTQIVANELRESEYFESWIDSDNHPIFMLGYLAMADNAQDMGSKCPDRWYDAMREARG